MPTKIPKTRNSGTLTERGFINWLVSLLRKGSLRWRPRNAVMRAARVGKVVNPKTGRLCWGVKCAGCKETVLEKDAQADHITPVVPVGKTLLPCHDENFNKDKHICLAEYSYRMFREEEHWQCLCKPCHKTKTKQEQTERRGK